MNSIIIAIATNLIFLSLISSTVFSLCYLHIRKVFIHHLSISGESGSTGVHYSLGSKIPVTGNGLDNIWRARKDAIFNNKGTSFRSIILQAQNQVQAVIQGKLLLIKLDPLSINGLPSATHFWNPPPSGFVCNSGAVAGCGGLLRNNGGEFILAFAMRLHLGSVLECEALAVYHGLSIAWGSGYRSIIV